MKAYVLTSGTVFALITVAHIWRFAEGPHLAAQPWFIVTTAIGAGLCGWAFRLLRRAGR